MTDYRAIIREAIISAKNDSTNFDYNGCRVEVTYDFISKADPYYTVNFNNSHTGLQFDARAMQLYQVRDVIDPIINAVLPSLKATCERNRFTHEIEYIYFN